MVCKLAGKTRSRRTPIRFNWFPWNKCFYLPLCYYDVSMQRICPTNILEDEAFIEGTWVLTQNHIHHSHVVCPLLHAGKVILEWLSLQGKMEEWYHHWHIRTQADGFTGTASELAPKGITLTLPINWQSEVHGVENIEFSIAGMTEYLTCFLRLKGTTDRSRCGLLAEMVPVCLFELHIGILIWQKLYVHHGPLQIDHRCMIRGQLIIT